MPVWDEEINAWREQSTLGCYLDYGPLRESRVKQVHAVSYAAHTVEYFNTVPEAKAFIEREAMRVRPDLSIQLHLPTLRDRALAAESIGECFELNIARVITGAR